MNFLKTTLLFLVFSCLACVNAYTQQTNFSGNWKLNEDKSDFGNLGFNYGSKLIRISQTAVDISIERFLKDDEGKEHSTLEKLSFDGKPFEAQTGDTHKSASAAWSADQKAITENTDYRFLNRDGDTVLNKATSLWSVSADGRALTLSYRLFDADNKEHLATYVYDKER